MRGATGQDAVMRPRFTDGFRRAHSADGLPLRRGGMLQIKRLSAWPAAHPRMARNCLSLRECEPRHTFRAIVSQRAPARGGPRDGRSPSVGGHPANTGIQK
jgi:hypothetical protein